MNGLLQGGTSVEDASLVSTAEAASFLCTLTHKTNILNSQAHSCSVTGMKQDGEVHIMELCSRNKNIWLC